MLPVSTLELLSKCVTHKTIALGLLAHISTRCCPVSWTQNLILGLRPKTEFFTVRKRDFAPFVFAYSDSGDSFGLQSWWSDWGEAWTQSLQMLDPRFCLPHLAGPPNQPKKKKPALHTILEYTSRGSWTVKSGLVWKHVLFAYFSCWAIGLCQCLGLESLC